MATEVLRPNADGDTIELTNSDSNQTDNWSYVDEESADNLSSYVFNGASSALLDLYNLPIHSGSGTINKIMIYARVNRYKETDYARIAIKTGGTVYYSGNLTTVPEAWGDKSYEWTNNPKTKVAWTWGNIDNLQIGVECALEYVGAFCTQLYVVVSYTYKNPFKLTFF